MDEINQVREKSLRLIEEENLRYQAVPLPGGISTAGYDRGYLNEKLFGDDFSGKSFLDIGSYLGYFCIEALRRGGSIATGIETDIAKRRQAQKIAELWNLSPQYIQDDFEDWDAGNQKYDVVACLNVLHHLYDPIHAIRKMISITRSKIILEIAVPTWRDILGTKVNLGRILGFEPSAIYLRKPKGKKYSNFIGRTYLFTPRALEIIFNVHTSMFEPLKIQPSPFKGRMVVVAQRRRIGHLVVVSGPTSVGKSTLSALLAQNAELRRRFDMEEGDWPIIRPQDVFGLASQRHDGLILHYDFLRPARTGLHSHARDPALHIMSVAERVTILTLVTSRKQLAEQLYRGEIQREGTKTEQKLELLNLYKSPTYLQDWYAAWKEFCERFPSAHRVTVQNDGNFTPRFDGNWGEILESQNFD